MTESLLSEKSLGSFEDTVSLLKLRGAEIEKEAEKAMRIINFFIRIINPPGISGEYPYINICLRVICNLE